MTTNSARRRLLWMLGCCSALLVVAVVAWVGVCASRTVRHNRAVAEIKAVGGSIDHVTVNAPGWWAWLLRGGTPEREVNDVYFNNVKVPETFAHQLKQFRSLRRLTLISCEVPVGFVSDVAELRSVESLFLSFSHASDSHLAELQTMRSLIELSLAESSISNTGLKHLVGMTDLRNIRLWLNPQVGDSGIVNMGPKPNLLEIQLDRTGVGDAAIEYLAVNSPLLEEVSLNDTRITDVAMRHLATLRLLCHLRVSSTAISDHGLEHLANHPKLVSLNLRLTKVKGPGLRVLPSMTACTELYLDGTEISDEALKHLEGTNLEELDLRNTSITDAAIPSLKRIPYLRVLNVTGTRITKEGAKELHRAMPDCSTYHLHDLSE